MKSVLILRHAEAVAARPGLADVDRPLTEKGRIQATALGRDLRLRGLEPGRVLCSVAARARETAEALTSAAGWTTDDVVLEKLYNATASEMLAETRMQPDDVAQICVVAHAPGVADLVSLMTTKHDDLKLYYAAATLAEVLYDVNRWHAVHAGAGVLRMIVPA